MACKLELLKITVIKLKTHFEIKKYKSTRGDLNLKSTETKYFKHRFKVNTVIQI